MQRLHRLCDWRRIIPSMYLKKIDIIHIEAGEAIVHRLHQSLARKPARIGCIAPRDERLGRDHNLIALRIFLQKLAGDFFGRTARIAIGGVEEIDARFQRALEEGPRGILIEQPVPMPALGLVAITHTAKAQLRDGQTRIAKARKSHSFSLFSKAIVRHQRSATAP